MSDLEGENTPERPSGLTPAATCVVEAAEKEEKKSPLPESEPDELPKGTSSRDTCLSASPNTGHKRTAGGRTSPS